MAGIAQIRRYGVLKIPKLSNAGPPSTYETGIAGKTGHVLARIFQPSAILAKI